jgi:uncharacterized protein YjdB
LSCSSDTTAGITIGGVSLSQSSLTMTVGQTVTITATTVDESGNSVVVPITWTSSAPTVVSVTGGVITALAVGQSTVTASALGRSGSAVVTVTPAGVASISIAPTTATRFVGQTVQLNAAVNDASGAPLTGRAVVWTTSDAAVASVLSTGLVTAVGAGAATITAASEGKTASAAITVMAVPVASVEISPPTASLTPGQTIQLTATARDSVGGSLSGRVTTWASSNGSIATVTATGLVTGVLAGTASISATSEGKTATASIHVSATPIAAITVAPGSANIAVGATTSFVATAFDASGNTLGGRPVTWSTLSSGIATVSGTGVVTGVAAGTTTVFATAEGKTGTATVIVTGATLDIATTSLPNGTRGVTYSQSILATGGSGARTWSVSSGALPAGLSLGTTTGLLTGTPTAAGTFSFSVRVASADGQSDTQALSLIIVQPTLAIQTTTLPAATRNTAYAQTLVAAGGNGTNTWSVTSGSTPAGLSLASATGVISGTPTTTGTSSFTVRVQSGDGQTDTRGFSITVGSSIPTLSITTTSLANATQNAAYTQTLTATGGNGVNTWSVSVGTLPAGLALASSTGVISGTPTAAGTSSFTVQVQSADGQIDTQPLSITVTASFATLTVTTSSLPSGTRGTAYSQTLGATGGNGVNTWSVSAGALPAGLALASATGVVSGIPTTAGTASFTVRVQSGDGQTATKPLSITIAQPTLSIATSTLPGGTVGTAYSQTLTASGGSGSNAWTISAGTLPAGLTLASATGVVSGTPTTAGTSNFTVQAASTDGQTATRALSIVVAAGTPGGTVLFQESFEDNNLTARGWYDAGGAFTTTTAEHQAGSRSLQATFAQGASTPSSWHGVRHLFTPTNQVYMSFWVKYSSNWVGSGVGFDPHEFHFITTEDGQFANSVTHLSLDIEHNYQASGGIPSIGWEDVANIDQTKINQNLVGVTENRAVAGCNGNADGYTPQCYNTGNNFYANGKVKQASQAYFLANAAAPGYKGNWHKVEVYFKLNTISGGTGQLDGIAQYWFDGALIIDLHNVQFRTAARPNMLFNQLTFVPFMGNGSPVTQSAYYDELVVMTAPPAP